MRLSCVNTSNEYVTEGEPKGGVREANEAPVPCLQPMAGKFNETGLVRRLG